MVSSYWTTARVRWYRAPNLKLLTAAPAVTRGEQSRVTGHQQLRIMQWNAEGVRQKKTDLQQFLKTSKTVFSLQVSTVHTGFGFFIRGYTRQKIQKVDQRVEL